MNNPAWWPFTNVRTTAATWQAHPPRVQRTLQEIATGQSPHVRFAFVEMRFPRGEMFHYSHSEPLEVRLSILAEFVLPDRRTISMHLYEDGELGTREEAHNRQNARQEQEQRLTTVESQFPGLGHTQGRQAAYSRMMQAIRLLRQDRNMSLMARLIERDNIVNRYREFLRQQAAERDRISRQLAEQRAGEGGYQ